MGSGTSMSGGETPGAKAHEHQPRSMFNTVRFFPPMASGRSAAVTFAAKTNQSDLPAVVMRSIALTSFLPISSPSPRPLSNNLVPFQYPQEEAAITNNQGLPDPNLFFYIANDQFMDVLRELKSSVKATMVVVGTSTSCMDTLAASTASLEQVVNTVEGVYPDQCNMRMMQQSYGDSLDAELDGIDRRKHRYNIIFTSLAAICASAALISDG